jgi:hypothetical protein
MVGVCDPGALPAVYEKHELDGSGGLDVTVAGRVVRAAGNRALTQVVPTDGMGDFVPIGRQVSLTGVASRGSVLYLRAGAMNRRLVAYGEALFTRLGLEHGGTATVIARVRAKTVSFALRRPDGTVAVPAAVTGIAGPGVGVPQAVLRDGYADSPPQAAATYVRAIEARDGETICALLEPQARHALTRGSTTPCWYLLHGLIGARLHENDPTQFSHMHVRSLDVGNERTIAGHRYRDVHLSLAVTYDPAPSGTRQARRLTDVVWLEQLRGQWRIAKPSAALSYAMGATGAAQQTLAPPDPLAAEKAARARARTAAATRRAAARSLVTPQQRPPQCSGTRTTVADRRGDSFVTRAGAPVSARVLALLGGQADLTAASFEFGTTSACVTFTLARPPSRPVVLELQLTTKKSRLYSFWVEFTRAGIRAGRPLRPGVLDANDVKVGIHGTTVTARFPLHAPIPAGARWQAYAQASGAGGMGEDQAPSRTGAHTNAVDGRTGRIVQIN